MKGQKLTFKEFSQRTYELYGDKYDISKVDLLNRNEKGEVCILYHHENEDVEFWMTPSNFLRGKCIFPQQKSKKKPNFEKIITTCKERYGSLYDLTKFISEGCDKNYYIEIGCKKHGWVKVNMYKFKDGCGCPKCKKEEHHYKYTTESYIEACKKVHDDKYDLSTIVFNGIENPITVRCLKHGEFTLSAEKFLKGCGCKYCGYENLSILKRKPLQKYIEDAKKVHGNQYIIDETIGYTTTKEWVFPICPKHGRFKINASSFLSGCGCAKCGVDSRTQKLKMTFDEFKERSILCHKEKYDYSRINKEKFNYEDEQLIGCLKHQYFFKQLPEVHLRGCGCPKCAKKKSEGEDTIYKFACDEVGFNNVIHNDRSVLGGKEIDVYIPMLKIGIEFNGIIYHSEKYNVSKDYHLNKTLKAQEAGVKLIHIFEDEWIEHKELIKDKLRHIFNKEKNKIKIGGRKCNVREIASIEAKNFLKKYHIQGWAPSTVYCGAYYQNKLVGVMSFLKESDGRWNLTRFSTDINYAIPGLASKLFKFFINNHNENVKEVKTFLDRRWSWTNINVYDRMGFELIKIIPPSYSYVKGKKRYHKFGFRKHILHKKYGLPLTMTELEMTKQLGYYRIWDCGLYKYTWKNTQEH